MPYILPSKTNVTPHVKLTWHPETTPGRTAPLSARPYLIFTQTVLHCQWSVSYTIRWHNIVRYFMWTTQTGEAKGQLHMGYLPHSQISFKDNKKEHVMSGFISNLACDTSNGCAYNLNIYFLPHNKHTPSTLQGSWLVNAVCCIIHHTRHTNGYTVG